MAPNFPLDPLDPLDPRVARQAYWHLKKSYLPGLYRSMLRGRLRYAWHQPRTYPEEAPAVAP